MSYIIEDGKGSTVKAEVSADHLRTLAYSASLLNHISGEITEKFIPPEAFFGEGVYTIRNNQSGSFGISGTNIINMANGDLINILIIDRISIQIVSSSRTLPDSRYEADLVALNNVTLSSPLSPLSPLPQNDNRSINNLSNIFSFTGGTPNLIAKFFPVLGDAIELIPQTSDSILLTYGNGINISIGGLGGTYTIEAFMRVAIIDPKELM